MKKVPISNERLQIRAFAAAFPIEEIKQYIEANRADYEKWLAEKKQAEAPPPKRRVSRKGAA
jgi:DNA-binding transcriptional MerR regulator